MYKVAVFDDNRASQQKVIDLLDKNFAGLFDYITVTNPSDLISSASIIDILIMDIDLGSKKMNGIDIACSIKKNNKDCQVIFVSAYNDYAMSIFEANPVFFLEKPLENNEQTFVKAIRLALENVDNNRNERFYYHKESRVYVVPVKDILYFESSRRIVKIVTTRDTDTFYDTLNDIEDRIPEGFIRIHQSYLVNTRYIKKLSGSEIELFNEVFLPVSKPRLTNVKEELIRVFSNNM